jgi:hypothetical protein
MPYCENCGTQLNPNANFCRNCGEPQKSTQTRAAPQIQPATSITPQPNIAEIPQIPSPTQQQTPEQILNFIIVSRPKRFGGQDYFTAILTSHQLIFVPMTSEMLKEVTAISRQQAKNKSNIAPVYPYQQRYLTIAPSVIMNQTQGCFAINNLAIREINLRLVSVPSDGYADFEEFEIQIIADLGTQVLRMTKRDEYVARLKQAYQDKLRLPSNYRLNQ